MRFLAPSVSLLPLQLVLPGDESLLLVALSLRSSGINDYTNKQKLRAALPSLNKPMHIHACMSVRTWACVCVCLCTSVHCVHVYICTCGTCSYVCTRV